MSVRLLGRALAALVLGAVLLPLAAVGAGAALSYTVSTTPPTDLANGGPAEEFDGTATNNTAAPLANARYDFTISGPAGFDAADLVLEYEIAADTFAPVPLTDCGSQQVCGEFGPHTGFPLPPGATTTTFRVSSDDQAPTGTLTIVSNLDTVDPILGTVTQTLATDSDTTTLTAPAVTIDLPDSLTKGAEPVEFTGSVTNDTGSDYPAVRYDFVIDGPDGLTADDLTVEFLSGEDTWSPVPLTDGEGVINGEFGPHGGFALPDGANTTTTFRVAVAGDAPVGPVSVDAFLRTVDGSGNVTGTVASDSDDTEIVGTDAPQLTLDMPADVAVGDGAEEFDGTLTNFTGEDIEAAMLRFVITGPEGLTADDLVLEYLDGDTFVPLELTDTDDGITGSYGGPEGFPLPDGSTETATLRITALAGAPTGELTLTVDLVDLSGADETVATVSDTTELTAPTLELALPDDLVIDGDAETGTLTVTNDTGSVYEAVRADVVITGPDGFDSDDITVEFDEPSTPATDFQPVELTDGPDDTVTASIPADGTTLPEGTTAITIRVTANEGAPAGTVTADVDLVALDEEGGSVEPALATASDSTTFASAEPVDTTTDIAVAPNPARAGQQVTVTVTVDSESTTPTGTVTFKDGSTTLAANVPLTDGTATFQTSSFSIGDHALSATYNPAEGFSTSSDSVNLRVTPATLTGRFVDQVYRLILLRPVDPSGLTFWNNQLNSGNLTRQQFVLVLVRQPEVRNRTCNTLYTQTLNRSGDAGGLAFCSELLRQGASFRSIQSVMAASAEFFQQAGSTNPGFVNLLYQRALGRSADPGGLAAWTAFLAQGHSRFEVASAIYNSNERLGRFVDASYLIFLGRAPDAGGRAFWINRLAQGQLEEVLWSDLIGSQEFLDKVP